MNNLKLVSFEVAKALKKFGYPQSKGLGFDSRGIGGKPVDKDGYSCPTYLEAWLWLWREGRFKIDLDECFGVCMIYDTAILDYRKNGDIYEFKYTDPEVAIEKAIEYLVVNNLIK